jgi:betaine/carnitine transporter, BCCT family
MSSNRSHKAKKPIDRPVFAMAFLIVLLISIPLVFWPVRAGILLTDAYDWIAINFGLAYQWATLGALIFMGWLAFSKYGHVLLGDADDQPEFSTFSWVSMLFSAGVGASVLYWASIEWGFYVDQPPMGVAPRSDEAYAYASAYGLFHWGVAAWALYALPTIAISYQFYVHKVPHLRLSTACHGLFGKEFDQSAGAKAMDMAFMIALLAGSGTSIGLAVPMITAALSDVFGFQRSVAIDMIIVIICVLVFLISSWLGLKRGIKRLSDFNIILAIFFLLFVLVTGPTLFILAQGTDSLGFMLSEFVRMITWTDQINPTGFVKDWTIFYWAWWIAYAPFIGVFVTRISRGRTIKQVIVSMTLFGSLGAWAFYIILGNHALYLELNHIVPVTDLMNSADPAQAITAVVGYLPFSQLMLFVLAVLGIIFIATTYDSASYTLAAAATKDIHAGENPARWHRLFWAIVVGVLPVALMVVGDTKVFQSMVLIASLPLLVIGVIMSIALMKSLRADVG